MRIVFLARSLERGGAERQLVALANGLAERGHRVVVALFYSGGALERDLKNVDIIDLNKTGRWDVVGFCQRLIREVRMFQPDAIYSFLGTSNILAAIFKKAWRGARVIWSVRASDMDFSKYDSVTRVSNWLEAKFSFFADEIIANSEAGKAHAIKRGMPEELCSVVPNGIDVERFRADKTMGQALRQDWLPPKADVLIGLIARIDPMKDHETFIRAAQFVAEKDAGIHFVCVGGGDGDYVNKIKNLSGSLGLDGSLTWAGELDYMEPVYNALNICCLSSLTEGFPNVVAEAMSCNIPCVVTDVGDAASIVGDLGMVVEKKEPEKLAKAMLEMASKERRNEQGNLRLRIVNKYSLEKMVVKTEGILQAGVDDRA